MHGRWQTAGFKATIAAFCRRRAMRLTHIKLSGFKSFAETTVIAVPGTAALPWSSQRLRQIQCD
uniref:Uncharacterized protein n=1 Tax=Conchiformibius kuhniae TaxID=211502 RepID=A0A8T9MZ61_9NEIS|nr:hypothetical protein LVJ77_04895 [Conchiformibius kuhniae]